MVPDQDQALDEMQVCGGHRFISSLVLTERRKHSSSLVVTGNSTLEKLHVVNDAQLH